MPFNNVLNGETADQIMKSLWSTPGDVPQEIKSIFSQFFYSRQSLKVSALKERAKAAWAKVHKEGWFKNKEGKWVKRKSSATPKNFQYTKQTPPDPRDGHVHKAAFDEDGNGGTGESGDPAHVHAVFGFKVQPYYRYNHDENSEFVSVHPGSIAFSMDDMSKGMTPDQKKMMKKCMDDGGSASDCKDKAMKKMSDLGEFDMEIFRVGTHNGDVFTEGDLQEIVDNFRELKNEIRPKLKITNHGEETEQMQLAGLASYGDIVDVYLKQVDDGPRRLFAKINNVPREVLNWIRDRRFPERSIEIYPEFTVGTKDDAPTYKNVLKAIALLGHEMPAVTGMAPIKLEECLECQGTTCVIQSFEAMGDTHTEDTDEATAPNPDPEGEGTVKCPNCQYDIPVEKLENDNTGYSQCPQCGKRIDREDVENQPAAEDLYETEVKLNLLKTNVELIRDST